MKRRKILLGLTLTLVLICGIAIGAGAASTLQDITAQLNSGITIKYDGEAQIFKDVNGTRVYPITYQGTTYLPIRAVGNLLGLDVNWDQATQTVLLGQPTGVDLIDDIGLYAHVNAEQHQTSEGKTKNIGGEDVSHWVQFSTGGIYAEAHFNVGGKYSTLTFQVFAGSSSQTGDTTMTVYGDNGSVLAEVPLSSNAAPKTVTVPLFNTTEVFFKAKPDYRYNMYIFDAHLS